MKISELKPDAKNANRGTKRGAKMIQDSLREYGAGRSILLDKNNRIIAGNKTAENAIAAGMEDVIVVDSDGTKVIAVRRTDLDLETDSRAKELGIADNRAGQVSLEWDAENLQALDIDLTKFWYEAELETLIALDSPTKAIDAEQAKQTLSERFGVPPFSVLDARQGYWQDRKRAWLSLGIQSEIGRGTNALDMSAAMAGVTDPAAVAEWNAARRVGGADSRAIKDHDWQKKKLGKVQAPSPMNNGAGGRPPQQPQPLRDHDVAGDKIQDSSAPPSPA